MVLIYLLALVSIVLGAVGQFLMKLGAVKLQPGGGATGLIRQVLTTPELITGLICFGSSFLLWIFVLRKLDLSTAYPLVSLSYIIVTLLAVFVLHEAWTLPKLMGLVLIISGVMVLNLGSVKR